MYERCEFIFSKKLSFNTFINWLSFSLQEPSWILVLPEFQLDTILNYSFGVRNSRGWLGYSIAELTSLCLCQKSQLHTSPVNPGELSHDLHDIFISDIQFDFQVSQSRKKKKHESKMKQNIFQLVTTPSSLMWKKIHFILPLPADWHELSCPSKFQPLEHTFSHCCEPKGEQELKFSDSPEECFWVGRGECIWWVVLAYTETLL